MSEYTEVEMEAMLETYRQFQILTPAKGRGGSAIAEKMENKSNKKFWNLSDKFKKENI